MQITKALALTSLCGSLLPGAAHAQGWRWQSALVVAERGDDNLFARPVAPERDWITGVDAGLAVAGGGPRRSWQVHYRQGAERYAAHPELDTLDARRDAGLHWQARATRTLDASVSATYLRTASAGELYRSSGVDLGRLSARRLRVTTDLVRRLSARSTLSGGLAATRDEVEGAAALGGAVLALRLDHDRSPQTRLSVRTDARWYDLAPGSRVASQLVAVGCRRRVGPAVELGLDAGPRLGRGTASAEWLASLRTRGRRGEWTIEWGQGEVAVAGVTRPVVTQRLGTSLARSVGALDGRLALDLLRNSGGLETAAWQASAEARLRLADAFAIALAGAWSRQREGSPASAPGEVRHFVTELRLSARPGRRREIADVR